jgi:hypothetical protein
MSHSTIALVNRWLSVVIEPENGANIRHVGRGSAPQQNVLAEYDWASPLPAGRGLTYGDSRLDWLSGYRGGWQLLTPNAGAECEHLGVTYPFHGEVSTAAWSVDRVTPSTAVLSTGTRGPIKVERHIALDAGMSAVEVDTVLINESQIDAHALVVEHIAFRSGSGTIVDGPAESHWRHDPASPEDVGQAVPWNEDLRHPVHQGEFRLAYLEAGCEGWMNIVQPELQSVCRVLWDSSILPSLWYWQERGTEGFPWYGRADITALEPASTSPSDGLAAAIREERAMRIPPRESLRLKLRLELDQLEQPGEEEQC